MPSDLRNRVWVERGKVLEGKMRKDADERETGLVEDGDAGSGV